MDYLMLKDNSLLNLKVIKKIYIKLLFLKCAG